MNKLSAVRIGDIFGSKWGTGGSGIASFVSTILFNALALAGVILFILIIVGGVMLIAGAGGGNKEDIAKGKKAITSAIFGFIIIFISYWIIRILEAVLGFQIRYPSP